MFGVKRMTLGDGSVVFHDPPIARFLFGNTRMAIIWLVVRLYVGWEWLEAGWHKFNDPAWMSTGTGILGYWKAAVAIPPTVTKAPITFDWFRDFLNLLIASHAETWMSKVIVIGELAIGLGLILGAFVGVAACFGAFMNMNFMLAGTTSANPVLFLLAVLLILAWKVAGYYGLDRWLLPMVGTPWERLRMPTTTAPTATPTVTPSSARA